MELDISLNNVFEPIDVSGLEQIGKGAFGTVYRSGQYAIKIPGGHMADREQATRNHNLFKFFEEQLKKFTYLEYDTSVSYQDKQILKQIEENLNSIVNDQNCILTLENPVFLYIIQNINIMFDFTGVSDFMKITTNTEGGDLCLLLLELQNYLILKENHYPYVPNFTFICSNQNGGVPQLWLEYLPRSVFDNERTIYNNQDLFGVLYQLMDSADKIHEIGYGLKDITQSRFGRWRLTEGNLLKVIDFNIFPEVDENLIAYDQQCIRFHIIDNLFDLSINWPSIDLLTGTSQIFNTNELIEISEDLTKQTTIGQYEFLSGTEEFQGIENLIYFILTADWSEMKRVFKSFSENSIRNQETTLINGQEKVIDFNLLNKLINYFINNGNKQISNESTKVGSFVSHWEINNDKVTKEKKISTLNVWIDKQSYFIEKKKNIFQDFGFTVLTEFREKQRSYLHEEFKILKENEKYGFLIDELGKIIGIAWSNKDFIKLNAVLDILIFLNNH